MPAHPGLRPAPAAAGAAQPAVERGQVHRVRRGRAGRSGASAEEHFTTPALHRRRRRAGLRGDRHRHRHPARAAAHDLRGVPAGGRHDQPQVRRHRPRPVDQPGDRAADRRRDPRRERARAAAARSRSTCPPSSAAAGGRTAASLPAGRQAAARPPAAPSSAERVPEQVEDDDGDIVPGDRVLLVALAEPELCRAAVEVGRGHGFKVLATPYADRALAIAEQRHPDGMVVGMDMASHDGTSLHHLLKRLDRTRDIPMVAAHTSAAAETAHAGLAGRVAGRDRGAVHPGEGRRRPGAPGGVHRAGQAAAAGGHRRRGQPERRGGRAVRAAATRSRSRSSGPPRRPSPRSAAAPVDCVLVDLALPDGGGLEVLKRIRARKQAAPHARRASAAATGLSAREEARLAQYAETLTLARPQTLDELVDARALFLHRSDVAGARAAARPVAATAPGEEQVLRGQADPHRRRRRPERVRPHQRAGAARHRRALRGERRGGPGHPAPRARHRPGADGRDDARHGRLHRDAGDPQDAERSGTSR